MPFASAAPNCVFEDLDIFRRFQQPPTFTFTHLAERRIALATLRKHVFDQVVVNSRSNGLHVRHKMWGWLNALMVAMPPGAF
jgi:hypothetical protein